MIGIVMAGGRGSRMGLGQEKLLLRHKKQLVLCALDALDGSGCFSKVAAATSPNSPQTERLLRERGYHVIGTGGAGYSEDLNSVLRQLAGPVFVTSADMPLLDGEVVRQIVNMHDSSALWTSIISTKKFRDKLGLSHDSAVTHDGKLCSYTGISMVDSSRINSLGMVDERFIILDDRRVAFNLNTRQDCELLGVA